MSTLIHIPIHGDGARPIERVRRLEHELALEDFEWDPATGEARCEYQSAIGERDGFAPVVRMRTQPSGRWHAGWRMWNGRYTTERVA